MKSLKRFSKRQKIVALSLCALSLCALVVIIGVVLRNADPYRRLEKENVLVVFVTTHPINPVVLLQKRSGAR